MTGLFRSRNPILSLLLTIALIPLFGCPQNQGDLESRVEALETALATTQSDLAEAQAKLAYVSIQQGSMNGVNGPHMIIEGCNLHVRSGSGATDDNANLTGLGNLIIGYNEQPTMVTYGRSRFAQPRGWNGA